MDSKKAMGAIISSAILFGVVLIVGIGMINWQIGFQSEWNTKLDLSASSGPISILELTVINSTESTLGVKNKGASYHIINSITISGSSCSPTRNNVVEFSERIYVNCSVVDGDVYTVSIFGDKGVFTKTLTAYN
jgi:hypothetical protein